MFAELVYDGGIVKVPGPLGVPRDDQMQGTEAERLMEVCGRTCYDSMGTGRPSNGGRIGPPTAGYHTNLLFTQRHYSVAEHVHFTVETDLTPCVWVGIPDMSVERLSKHRIRLTANLRHALEWPDCVTHIDATGGDREHIVRWQNVLQCIARDLCPNVFTPEQQGYISTGDDYELVDPEHDVQSFVSVFMEDSRVWSHEQVRHRGNMSQRSGRFVDETDRGFCMHPHLRDYLNECGFLKNGETPAGEPPPDRPRSMKGTTEEPMFEGGTVEIRQVDMRTRLGLAVGQHIAQGTVIYSSVVEALQPWLVAKGLDATTARKQARSAARYYLGNGLSTEMVFTASVRHWRHIFAMRCAPSADAAIRELCERVEPIVRGSRFGYLL